MPTPNNEISTSSAATLTERVQEGQTMRTTPERNSARECLLQGISALKIAEYGAQSGRW